MTAALERLWVWTGGGLFVASLSYTAWWYAVTLDRALPFSGLSSIALDLAIFTAFAAHHSMFARTRIKQALSRVFPDRLLRSVYVWIANLLLIVVCGVWQPIGGDLYHIHGWPATINATVQLAGFLLIALSVRAIDALELAGIRRNARDGELQAGGPYGLVRHPLYLGWMLIVFGAAHMTGDRLAFATITSVYLVIAIPWEERALETTFGDRYQRYKQQVRWRVVPYIY